MAESPIGCCIARANRGSFKPFMRTVWIIILCLSVGSNLSSAQNKVLSLDGLGAHVRLPDGLFDRLEEGTVEVWVNWADLGFYSPALILGESGRCLGFNHVEASTDLQFFLYPSHKDLKVIKVSNIIRIQEWMHLAGVFGPEGMKLYVNGTLVGENDTRDGFGLHTANSPSSMGKRDHPQNQPFKGMIDEVRIWDHAREPSEIRGDMATEVSGDQPGLLGYWNFDQGDASDGTRFKKNGELVENAICIPFELPHPEDLESLVKISGRVLDSDGNPALGAFIQVFHNNRISEWNATTDADGRFKFWCSLSDQTYDLRVSKGDQSAWLTDASIERLAQAVSFRLRPVGQISGMLRGFDGTGHAFHFVQAVQDDVVIDTAFADMSGNFYSFIR